MEKWTVALIEKYELLNQPVPNKWLKIQVMSPYSRNI